MRKEEVVETAPVAAPEVLPRFMVLSTLFMQVTDLKDLPSGSQLLYDELTGVYKDLDADNVPPARMAELIASGRVYALWGRHMSKRDELEPGWHELAYRPVPTV